MTTDTPTPALPEWPTDDPAADWTDCMVRDRYHEALAEAALARMEALAAFVEANRHAIRAPMTVAERNAMDALLAACERPGERREG